jgi:hypothetical protein
MTPPVAPAASVTPESHAVVSDPKAQPAIPADAAEKAAPPTPTPGPAIAAAPTAAGAAQPQPAPPETEATPATRNANEASDERKASNPPPSGVAAPQPVASETKAEPADPSAGKDGEPAKAVDPAPTPRVIAVAPPETQEPPADPAGDSGKASPAAPMSANAGAQPQRLAQVLIVMARPDVKDVADLRDKSVLVDGAPLISNEQLKASFAAAGASGAEFKHGDENDIERFVRGEFAAAVVGVVAPGLANYTREIPGFHLLRVEVSPPSKP